MDEEKGVAIVQEAFKLGINFFDTSPFYGNTRSEQAGVYGDSVRKHSRLLPI